MVRVALVFLHQAAAGFVLEFLEDPHGFHVETTCKLDFFFFFCSEGEGKVNRTDLHMICFCLNDQIQETDVRCQEDVVPGAL